MGVCAHIFLQIPLSQCDSHSVILKISAQGCGSLSFKSVAVTSSMFSNPYYFQFAVFTAACHSQCAAPTLLNLNPLTGHLICADY